MAYEGAIEAILRNAQIRAQAREGHASRMVELTYRGKAALGAGIADAIRSAGAAAVKIRENKDVSEVQDTILSLVAAGKTEEIPKAMSLLNPRTRAGKEAQGKGLTFGMEAEERKLRLTATKQDIEYGKSREARAAATAEREAEAATYEKGRRPFRESVEQLQLTGATRREEEDAKLSPYRIEKAKAEIDVLRSKLTQIPLENLAARKEMEAIISARTTEAVYDRFRGTRLPPEWSRVTDLAVLTREVLPGMDVQVDAYTDPATFTPVPGSPARSQLEQDILATGVQPDQLESVAAAAEAGIRDRVRADQERLLERARQRKQAADQKTVQDAEMIQFRAVHEAQKLMPEALKSLRTTMETFETGGKALTLSNVLDELSNLVGTHTGKIADPDVREFTKQALMEGTRLFPGLKDTLGTMWDRLAKAQGAPTAEEKMTPLQKAQLEGEINELTEQALSEGFKDPETGQEYPAFGFQTGSAPAAVRAAARRAVEAKLGITPGGAQQAPQKQPQQGGGDAQAPQQSPEDRLGAAADAARKLVEKDAARVKGAGE